jgi:periplasmic divalent cation tolerance protein
MAIVVYVTIPENEAEDLAKMLVKERVCACVSVIKGVRSFFWWKDKVDEASEAMLVIKTRDTLFAKLQTLIKNNHSYELPEIIAIKIENGSKEYLEWLNREASTTAYSI